LLGLGMVVAIVREGFSASVVANLAWGELKMAVFFEFIRAALPDNHWLTRKEVRSFPIVNEAAVEKL